MVHVGQLWLLFRLFCLPHGDDGGVYSPAQVPSDAQTGAVSPSDAARDSEAPSFLQAHGLRLFLPFLFTLLPFVA